MRQLGVVPASAQCLYQLHAGRELARSNVRCRAPVGQLYGLRGDHLEIDRQSAFVLVGEDRQRALRVGDRLLLRRRLLIEDAQRGELVFHILERLQHCLAIVRDFDVIPGARLNGKRVTPARIEEKLGGRSAKRPQ